MTQRSDFRVTASFPSGSCPRAPLDYFCTCFKTFDGSPVRTTFPTNTSAQIWLSRSRLFLKLFFSIFSVHLSSTIDLMKDTFTTCRTRQACWWRRSTQAQWYKVTSTAVENSPEVHEEMILTEISQTKSHDSITPHICLVCIFAATCSSAGLDSDCNTVLATSLNPTDVETLHTCRDCLWRNSEAY